MYSTLFFIILSFSFLWTASSNVGVCMDSCVSLSAAQNATCAEQIAMCPSFGSQISNNPAVANLTTSTTLKAERFVRNASGIHSLGLKITWSTTGATSQSRVAGYKLIVTISGTNHTNYYCSGLGNTSATSCFGQASNTTINPGDLIAVTLQALVNYSGQLIEQREVVNVQIPFCVDTREVSREFFNLPQCAVTLSTGTYDCCNRSVEMHYSLPKGYPAQGYMILRRNNTAVSRTLLANSPTNVTVPESNSIYEVTLTFRHLLTRETRVTFQFPNCTLFLTAEVQSCSQRTYNLSYTFPRPGELLFALTPKSLFAVNNHSAYHESWEAVNSTESRFMQIPEGYRKNYKSHTVQLTGYTCTSTPITQTVQIDFSTCCQNNVESSVILVVMVVATHTTKWIFS